jgi:hypothetical protein
MLCKTSIIIKKIKLLKSFLKNYKYEKTTHKPITYSSNLREFRANVRLYGDF